MDGSNITIRPTRALLAVGLMYSVAIAPGVFKDDSGNSWVGLRAAAGSISTGGSLSSASLCASVSLYTAP